MLGAVMLGVGAIFQPKARPGDHWSTSPKLSAGIEVDAEAVGGGGDDDCAAGHLSQQPGPPPDVRRQSVRRRGRWRRLVPRRRSSVHR